MAATDTSVTKCALCDTILDPLQADRFQLVGRGAGMWTDGPFICEQCITTAEICGFIVRRRGGEREERYASRLALTVLIVLIAAGIATVALFSSILQWLVA